MDILGIKGRRRIGEITIAGLILWVAWLIQLTILSKLTFSQVLCNLPLAMTIVWGATFGSPMEKPTSDELRVASVPAVLVRQLLSGSVSGALVGGFFAALSCSVLPVFPAAYPVIGWISGYFSLKNFNQAAFLCIPLVLLLTFLAEIIMAAQLALMGRPDVTAHFITVSFPEALLNALIAPVLFFPMRGWFEFSQWRQAGYE
jgi:rod shape-determining protein MreD